MMERLSRLDPANFGVLLDLGGFYGKRYDYAAAERCFERAVRIAPKKAETLAMAGQKSREFRKEDMAEAYLRRAAEQKDASPDSPGQTGGNLRTGPAFGRGRPPG